MGIPPAPYQSFRKKDGHFLYYRVWPCKSGKACLILLHGMGGYSGRFVEMGPYFQQHGFHVEAYDLEGYGVSDERKGHIDHFETHQEDLLTYLNKMEQAFPEKKRFVIAESLGGLITLDSLIKIAKSDSPELHGVVLMSPALQDNLPLSWRERLQIAYAALFKPKTYFPTPFRAEQFTRDASWTDQINDDPLEVREATAKLFYEILKTMFRVKAQAKHIHTPLLIQQAGEDRLVKAKATEAFYHRLTLQDKLFILYRNHYHALYLDQGREQVWQDALHWLNQHV